MEYLKGLSYDAVPEMERLIYSDLKNPDTVETKEQAVRDEVRAFFIEKKLELENQKHWQSFNISRYRASKVVDKYVE